MTTSDPFIERRIITGLITSTDYVQQIRSTWEASLLNAPTARTLASWCLDYFDKYNKAPGRDIEGIYEERQKAGTISSEKMKWIEDILSSLSTEYERTQFNVSYLLDQTKTYFQEQGLRRLSNIIRNELDTGNIIQAEKTAINYTSVVKEEPSCINPFMASDKFKEAFKEREHPLIHFPTTKISHKALGEFWNQELVRGAFVGLMGPEKRGKTYMLMELALRAMKSGSNVVFFQAGDMTEAQQLRRLGIHLTKQSDQLRYCKAMYSPVVDCLYNQLDECDRQERENRYGFGADTKKMGYEELVELHKEHNDKYIPCYNCTQFEGRGWLQWIKEVHPVTWKQAYKAATRFQKKHQAQFRLSTHSNESLSISQIKALLIIWERQHNFVPDVIIIDYADILAPDPDVKSLDFRNQTNKIWQRLRRLSQDRHCLVITATQAAATSYERNTLKLMDFSEDKRKYSHVTAMYGLNQSPEEKRIGILRLNELVLRESDFEITRDVKVLQRLQRGQTFLGSFF